jgi:hypothetical protein
MNETAASQVQLPDKRKLQRLRKLSIQSAWLFSVALFGYPLVGNSTSLLQIESRTLSIPFRIAVALFSVWVFLVARRWQTDWWRRVMLVIWFLYVVRLLHDWGIANLDGADYALQFFVATSVLPALALMKARAYQQRRFALIGFITASAGTIISLLATNYGSADVQDLTAASGRLSLTALNAVSLGNLATSAILCGFVLWHGASLRWKIFLAAMFVPLLASLAMTGSKGPAIGLVLCMGLWALRNGRTWRFALLSIPVLTLALLWEGNPLAARLSGLEEDESTVDRLVMISDSLDQIAGSPVTGSAFVELNSGFYPHNVFIEAALAMGIPVALLFAALMLFGAWRAWKTLNTRESLLGLLYIQALFAASTSGAIFGATMLWVILGMLPGSTAAAADRRTRTSHRELVLSPSG